MKDQALRGFSNVQHGPIVRTDAEVFSIDVAGMSSEWLTDSLLLSVAGKVVPRGAQNRRWLHDKLDAFLNNLEN